MSILPHALTLYHRPKRRDRNADGNLRPVDVVAPASSEADVKAKYMYGDLKDYGQVVGLLSEVDSVYRGIDAVIHIAAIPAPARSVRLLDLCTAPRRFFRVVTSISNLLEIWYDIRIYQETNSPKRPPLLGTH